MLPAVSNTLEHRPEHVTRAPMPGSALVGRGSPVSQVLPRDVMNPRKWRTTIDYRFYNKCITPQHWPLPNISNMIQRIGRAKPKYFAKLDMTHGYWQAPLDEKSKRFTAFITFMGIFEWNRVAMVTQPAGGYFQYCMAFIVFVGLIYTIM